MKILISIYSVVFAILVTTTVQAHNNVAVVPLGGDTYQAGVAKTGQTTCYKSPGVLIPCSDPEGQGQDGHLQKGVAWPNPRFTDLLDGTVKDNLTGLIWLKNADCKGTPPPPMKPVPGPGKATMADAYDFVSKLNKGFIETNCGDLGRNNDWRIPNRFELESLLDLSMPPANVFGVSLPSGHPFSNVWQDWYWTSSYNSFFADVGVGWGVKLSGGYIESKHWTLDSCYFWPVRGGN